MRTVIIGTVSVDLFNCVSRDQHNYAVALGVDDDLYKL